MMRLGLNGQSTRAPLERDLQVAEEAGFHYYEVPFAKLKEYEQAHTLGELRAYFDRSPLEPYSLNALTMFSFLSDKEEEQMLETLHEMGRIARALRIPYLVICPSTNVPGVSRQQIHEETVRVLRRMSEVAAKYQLGLALEFLGFQNCTVNELAQAYEIVKEVDRENVGLSVDTFHFYECSRLEDLRGIDKEKIFLFHINDADDVPKDQLTDADRVLPGLGVIGLAAFIETLLATGYDKMASVELFREEYYAWEPLELAVKARAATEAVLRLEHSPK